jgi:hypothetical protein
MVPVYMRTNILIAAAWQTAIDKPTMLKVFNCATGEQNPIICRELLD